MTWIAKPRGRKGEYVVAESFFRTLDGARTRRIRPAPDDLASALQGECERLNVVIARAKKAKEETSAPVVAASLEPESKDQEPERASSGKRIMKRKKR